MYRDVSSSRVVAIGHAETHDLASVSRNTVSLYADPVAWLVEAAARIALTEAAGDAPITGDDMGMLVVSAYGTRHTMRAIAVAAGKGRVSPLRFSGAAPGSLAGLTCIALGFHGPSLLLCASPEESGADVDVIANAWLTTGQCRYVTVVEHSMTGATHTADSTIVCRHEDRSAG